MIRVGNLYSKIWSMENIQLAHKKARKGKSSYMEVRKVNKNEEKYLTAIQDMLKNKTYKNSKYHVFIKKFRDKERVIYKLPYFPDRIVHHCIVQVLEPIWIKTFIRNTFSSIKYRGIHDALKRIQKDIKDDTYKYCLKFDIRKFYPSVDHDILKQIIRKKIKDKDVLELLDLIIDSAEGVPIGNYLSQFFGNLYLTYFDHWMKETQQCKYYYRYCDDIVVLGDNKEKLHNIFHNAEKYLKDNLKLNVKKNWQIFPISCRGIDFLGYVVYTYHTKIRKNIKTTFKQKVKTIQKYSDTMSSYAVVSGIMSYYGWFKCAKSFNLWNRYITDDICLIMDTHR